MARGAGVARGGVASGGRGEGRVWRGAGVARRRPVALLLQRSLPRLHEEGHEVRIERRLLRLPQLLRVRSQLTSRTSSVSVSKSCGRRSGAARSACLSAVSICRCVQPSTCLTAAFARPCPAATQATAFPSSSLCAATFFFLARRAWWVYAPRPPLLGPLSGTSTGSGGGGMRQSRFRRGPFSKTRLYVARKLRPQR